MPTPRPLKVSTPGDLAALVPHLTGFTPHESLVALSLRGRRQRLGLTLRADLVDHPALVSQVVHAMVSDRAATCAVLVHTDQPSSAGHPWSRLVAAVVDELASHGVAAGECLLVRQGRWWSYTCARSCCPAEGTPLDPDAAVVRAVAAEHAWSGSVVLGSRAELVASLRPRPVLGRMVAAARQDRAADALDARVTADPLGAERDEIARWRAALDAWEQRPAPPDPDAAAALSTGLSLVRVRDEVASWALHRSDALLGLLGELCRATTAPCDVPLCTVLGWVAYARGNGALALIALERATDSDPDYPLAGLLLTAIDRLLPPHEVRALLRAVA